MQERRELVIRSYEQLGECLALFCDLLVGTCQ
jgi:hypothetical protein